MQFPDADARSGQFGLGIFQKFVALREDGGCLAAVDFLENSGDYTLDVDWPGDFEVGANAFGQADQGTVNAGVLLHRNRDIPKVVLDGCEAGQEQGEGFLAGLECARLKELHSSAVAECHILARIRHFGLQVALIDQQHKYTIPYDGISTRYRKT